MPYLLDNNIFGQKYTFLCIGILDVFAFLFVFFIIRETKGLNDDECKTLYAPKASFLWLKSQEFSHVRSMIFEHTKVEISKLEASKIEKSERGNTTSKNDSISLLQEE